jgi:hypothetical protein
MALNAEQSVGGGGGEGGVRTESLMNHSPFKGFFYYFNENMKLSKLHFFNHPLLMDFLQLNVRTFSNKLTYHIPR